jgi:hypothetical protein
MRMVSVVACVAFFAGTGIAGTGSALAADCNKGMLWPFVRTTGDCLTDAEIAAGKTGVYSGPVNTNVDVSAIKPSETPVQNTGTSSGGGTGLVDAPLLGGGSGSSNGALISGTSIFGAAPKGRTDTDAGCTKGTLWPFKREPGDCLTADEKKAGKTGVYGGEAAVAQVRAANAAAAQAPAPAPAAASCGRSWLWPFVRKSGDCETTAEKKDDGK